MILQNIRERPLNKTSVPNSFKSFRKHVYQKESTQNVCTKKDQNNYFRPELSQKQEEIPTLTEKNRLTFNYRENLRLFQLPIFIKINLPTDICPTRNWQMFLMLTH